MAHYAILDVTNTDLEKDKDCMVTVRPVIEAAGGRRPALAPLTRQSLILSRILPERPLTCEASIASRTRSSG